MVILLVEDKPLIAMMLQEELANAGYTVCSPASTVKAGLEVAERERPDLALFDINLSDGSSGIDLARELLNRRGVPSLFVSGQRMEAYATESWPSSISASPTVPKSCWPASGAPNASWTASGRPRRRPRPGWTCSRSRHRSFMIAPPPKARAGQLRCGRTTAHSPEPRRR